VEPSVYLELTPPDLDTSVKWNFYLGENLVYRKLIGPANYFHFDVNRQCKMFSKKINMISADKAKTRNENPRDNRTSSTSNGCTQCHCLNSK
jgi:hypothetical protein